MDDNTKQVISQAASVMISGLFTYLSQQGLSDEEIDASFESERTKFLARKPENLPDA